MIQATEYFTNEMLTLRYTMGGYYLNIELNDKEKLATFWLTSEEQKDSLIQEQIRQKADSYQKQKYTVAVFCSGKSDLQSMTEGLLLHNQKVLARRDIKCEQEAMEAQIQLMSM